MVQGPEGWCQWQVRGVGDLNIAVMEISGAPGDKWWLLRGGRALNEGQDGLCQGDHIQVRFHGVGGGGNNEVEQAGATGGTPGGEGGASQTLERMMKMMKLQGEQLQSLAASTSGLRKEVEDLKSGKGKEQQREENDRHLQLFRNLVMLANVTCKVQLSIEHMTLSPNPIGNLQPFHLHLRLILPILRL